MKMSSQTFSRLNGLIAPLKGQQDNPHFNQLPTFKEAMKLLTGDEEDQWFLCDSRAERLLQQVAGGQVGLREALQAEGIHVTRLRVSLPGFLQSLPGLTRVGTP